LTLQARDDTRTAGWNLSDLRFFYGLESHVFPMTHHVECVAILEPVKKDA
jgi:hypothetical protein